MKKVFIIFLCLVFISKIAEAQYHRDYFSFGIGPAILYGESTGYYKYFRMKPLPAITMSYSYQQATHWDLRASAGIQRFDGAGIHSRPSIDWIANRDAYDAKGQAYFIDLMPVYQFNPVKASHQKHLVSYYAGLGLGLMHVEREVKIGVQALPGEEGGQTWNTITEEQSTTAFYFPVRVGISTNTMKNWDFGFEGSALTAASYNLDGNTSRIKFFNPDMLFQFQFVVKRNLDNW